MLPLLAMGLLAGAGNVFNAVSTGLLSRDQAKRADELRDDAGKLVKPQLQPAFRDAEKMRQMAYLRGMPGLAEYEKSISSNTADMAAKGKEASATGGDYLTYLAGLYNGSNKEFQNLYNQSAQYKASAFNDLANTEWAIGQEEKQNEATLQNRRDELYKQANDLEAASTQNKVGAIKQGIGGGLSMISGVLGASMADQNSGASGNYKSFFENMDKKLKNDSQDNPPYSEQGPAASATQALTIDEKLAAVKANGAPWMDDPSKMFGGVPASADEIQAGNDMLKSIGINPTGGVDDIKAMQSYLRGSGYYTGSVDGRWGPKTAAAVKKYLDRKSNEFAPEDFNAYYSQSFVRPQ